MPHKALYEIFGEPVYACPVAGIDKDMANEAFGLYNQYRRGFLPYGGGIYDQPNKLLEMIEIVRSAKVEWDKERNGA